MVLREFSLRPGSGGAGKFKGGDGVVREVGLRMTYKLSVARPEHSSQQSCLRTVQQ